MLISYTENCKQFETRQSQGHWPREIHRGTKRSYHWIDIPSYDRSLEPAKNVERLSGEGVIHFMKRKNYKYVSQPLSLDTVSLYFSYKDL